MKIWFNRNLLNRIDNLKLSKETISEFVVRIVRDYVNKTEEEIEKNDSKRQDL